MNLTKIEQIDLTTRRGGGKSHHLRVCLAFVFVLLGVASCQTKPANEDVKAQTKEMFPGSKSAAAGSDSEEASAEGTTEGKWTILLLHLKGTAQEAATQAVLRSVRATGVPEAYLETRGENVLVVVGKYESPTSSDAKAMLKRVKELQIDNQRPYMAAHMLPPEARALKGSMPEWDLRNARAKYGKNAEYTLQINIYTVPGGGSVSAADLRQFQKAAEDAVKALRKDGTDAFYYHDQTGSTVTVGLFSQDDLDSGFSLKPGAGQAVRDLQKKFPYAMVNGRTVKEKSVDAQGKPAESLRPSFVVRVPN